MNKPIIILACVLCAGCEQMPEEQQPTITVTTIGSWSDKETTIYTVKHDDHSFVVARGSECVSIIHHPACPMEKGKE